jgi:O-antigen/teichoic acid export membrane protein
MAACIFVLQDAVLIGLRQAMWVPIENIMFASAKIMLLVVFARWFSQYGIFASWSIPLIVSLLPVNLLIFRRLVPKHVAATKEMVLPIIPKQVVGYIAGNYVGFLFLLASTQLLPVLVLRLAGNSASAYFYLPWMIGSSLQLVTANTSTSLTVEGTLDQAQLRTHVKRALRHALRLLLPAVTIIAVGAPYLLQLFGKSYAAEGITLLRLLCIATIPNIAISIHLGIARVQRRIARIVLTQAGASLLALSLSYVLLQRYGITGVGWAWLISQTTIAVLVVCFHLRHKLWLRTT